MKITCRDGISRIAVEIHSKVIVLTEVGINDTVEMNVFIISERIIIFVQILMEVIINGIN